MIWVWMGIGYDLWSIYGRCWDSIIIYDTMNIKYLCRHISIAANLLKKWLYELLYYARIPLLHTPAQGEEMMKKEMKIHSVEGAKEYACQ